jgi:hypothetical protein
MNAHAESRLRIRSTLSSNSHQVTFKTYTQNTPEDAEHKYIIFSWAPMPRKVPGQCCMNLRQRTSEEHLLAKSDVAFDPPGFVSFCRASAKLL